jgi:hypothetical protein
MLTPHASHPENWDEEGRPPADLPYSLKLVRQSQLVREAEEKREKIAQRHGGRDSAASREDDDSDSLLNVLGLADQG